MFGVFSVILKKKNTTTQLGMLEENETMIFVQCGRKYDKGKCRKRVGGSFTLLYVPTFSRAYG